MKIIITGGASFLGQRLAQALLTSQEFPDFKELYLIDVIPPVRPTADRRVRCQVADLAAPGTIEALLYQPVDILFHLAAIGYQQTAADFEFGIKINFDATRQILEASRRALKPCTLILTSSTAVGSATVTDATALHPHSAFGTQKALSELLIKDYSRRGLIDGRIVRLPLLRLEPASGQEHITTFLAPLIQNLLANKEVSWPIDPRLPLWLASTHAIVNNLLHSALLPSSSWGDQRVVTLPGITTTSHSLIETLKQRMTRDSLPLIHYAVDESLNAILAGQPSQFERSPAEALGFRGDRSLSELFSCFFES
ncbi:NAD-dependent epimerase/dehydratase family protein [unidentified bacterial endosymbiont]|uniref:NAD-dependent epimerase/dehydratase family protein n=1 Tax=unidentified bacterial endosymbiont TaxID=2355 RepID=UPI00209D1DF7|nr:NAD-dependent epimerase/dehydratase family protein [unidentified bacterial endosymbiont]